MYKHKNIHMDATLAYFANNSYINKVLLATFQKDDKWCKHK